jgi:hypothetical protein
METLITLRIDVDYPFPSRIRSFLYTALGMGTSNQYMKNSQIVARMINESPHKIKAYWFFTPKTIPDKELLALLDNEKHEIALHIVNDPRGELKNLEDLTGKRIAYYTIHGTARLFARVMWKRWKGWTPRIPEKFPLKSFHQFPTIGLDSLCYSTSLDQALKTAEDHIRKGDVVYFHPIWLFQRGKLNHRGPFYEAFKRILAVDSQLESLSIRKKFWLRIARDQREYERSIVPTAGFLRKLGERGTDMFTFLERNWCGKIQNPPKSWVIADDNIALLHLRGYDEWWKSISKKTRNMIRKAEKSGISTDVAEPDRGLAEGMWKIYNETPIRQERGFPHYGVSFHQVITGLHSAQNCTYIGAYFQDELAGFIQLVSGDNITIISQILSLQKHWDKAVNNALLAKTIGVCASRGVKWIMYGRIGNHPSLDNFKQNNGFSQFRLTRYYIPITRKGKLAIKLGLHKEVKDTLPQSMKYFSIPIYNWLSRNRMRIRLYLRQRTVVDPRSQIA